MRTARFAAIILFLASTSIAADVSRFDTHFRDKTMRVDTFHTGGPKGEVIALDRIVADGGWAGSRTRLIDTMNLGKYVFEVIDRETNQLLYSRGYATLYGEWETTPEVKQVSRTFHESLRFPWPKNAVQVVIKSRDAENSFHEIWSTLIDPNSRFVNPAVIKPAGKVWTVFESGPPSEKVDLVVLGEGYSEKEMSKFHADVERMVEALFATEPFKSRKKDFNVRAIDLPSSGSGVHRPRQKSNRRTPISAEYNIFDSDRYLLTYDNRALRDVASAAPYEYLEILVNEKKYGGGGIYNFQATASIDTAYAEYVFVHEFGHHFAALADEYYTSDVAYETGSNEHPEPWERNITALHDPAKLKWRNLVEPGTPIPTPWEKEIFEKHAREVQARRAKLIESGAPESEVDALFREQAAFQTKLLSSMQYSGKVGAFEGARYEAKGLYRPEADCIMFTRDDVGFCRVCSRTIERVIDEYSLP